MGFRDLGLEFGVQGFRVQGFGLEFGVQGFGFTVGGSGLRV